MGFGQAVGRGHCVPDFKLQIGHASLKQCGHFRHHAAAPGRGDADRAQLATVHLRHAQPWGQQRHLNLFADHADDHLRVAGIRHMQRRNAGARLDQLHANVGHGTHAW